MTKRVVIAGCRDYNNYDEAKKFIDVCIRNIRKENEIIIVSGGRKRCRRFGREVCRGKRL